MSTGVPASRHAAVATRFASRVAPGLALLALLNLAPALWIVVAPHGFFDQIGPFGVYNAHFLRDAAAFQGGLGLALAAAVVRPALRAGALAVATAVTTLHALNHWVDAGAAHAGSNAGPGDAVSLTVLAIATAGLLVVATGERAR